MRAFAPLLFVAWAASLAAGCPRETLRTCNTDVDCRDGESCRDGMVRDANPAAASGLYVLALPGGERFVECDMTTSGGGWALVVRFNEGDACPGDLDRCAARLPARGGCAAVVSVVRGALRV